MAENLMQKLSSTKLQDFLLISLKINLALKSHFKLLELQARGECH